MALIVNNPKPIFQEVSALTDVGTGALVSLSGEGFSAATQGFTNATDPYQNYPNGTVLMVRDATTSYLFVVGLGTVRKVAVLIGTLSSAAMVGAGLKYVVYSGSFNLPPTGVFTTIAAAITAANAENPAEKVDIIIAAGDYAESVTVRDLMSLVGLGSVSDDGLAGVDIVGDGVNPAITVPQSSNVSLQNIRVDGNGQRCLSFANVAGLSRITSKDCVFTTATTAFEVAGVNAQVSLDLRDCSVTGTAAAVAILGATGALITRGCQVSGDVDAVTLNSRDTEMTGVVSTTGTASAVTTTFGNASFGGAATALDCTFQGTSSFAAASTARRCSFAETANFAAAAVNSLLDQCTIQTTAGDGATVGAGHTVTLIATSIRANSGVALSGAGSAVIYGGLPGGGTISLPFANVTAISGQPVHQTFNLTMTGGTTVDPWPTSNPDRVRATPASTTASDSPLELPSADNQVPGREILVRNVDANNFMRVQPAAGDTLFDGNTAGNINLAPGDYRRFIAVPGTGWEVN